VAPSGYYEWLQQPISNRAQENARLLRLIRASFVASHGIYGAPRVFLDLREAGETCSKHRVARLMRDAGPMPGGQLQTPGGWNRVVLHVAHLPVHIETLKKAGLHFRNQMETGPGGKQIQLDDPDGNPIELFEPAAP
jgi:hypothetical protein